MSNPTIIHVGPQPPPPAPKPDLRAEVDGINEVWRYQPPADPRPDLFMDTENWVGLLTLAWLLPGSGAPDSLFWALQTTRCLGASLTALAGKGKIRAGYMPAEEYEQVRAEWLLPRMAELGPLLADTEKWAG